MKFKVGDIVIARKCLCDNLYNSDSFTDSDFEFNKEYPIMGISSTRDTIKIINSKGKEQYWHHSRFIPKCFKHLSVNDLLTMRQLNSI